MDGIHFLSHLILFGVGASSFVGIFFEETPGFARVFLFILCLCIFDVLFNPI